MPRSAERIPGRVVTALEQGLRGELPQPQMADLASHFFQMVGGERAVAKMLLEEYRSPTCSPMMRTRILTIVLGAMKFANERAPNIGDNLSLMSDEDLARELHDTILKLPGNKDDGEESPQDGETGAASST